MIRRDFPGDYLIYGLVLSLAWHLCWVFLFVPVVHIGRPGGQISRSIFLGPILKEADLSISSSLPLEPGTRRKPFSAGKDHGRQEYFSKEANSAYKPKALPAIPWSASQTIRPAPVLPSDIPAQTKDMSFGLSDYAIYLEKVDFRELKRVWAREDISPYLDFLVFLGSDGATKAIKKEGSSGDPAVDLYIMRKLKAAIFKKVPSGEGAWVRVRFRIKE